MPHDFRPAEAFHVGEYIDEELKARGWSAKVLAGLLDWPLDKTQRLLDGQERVLVSTAAKLERIFGCSFQTFLRLQRTYDEWKRTAKT